MDLQNRLSAALAGRYEIEGEIGRGGMAVVYLARDLKHQRRVAAKVLRPEFAASLTAERFLREIQIAAKLQHPLLVPLYDSGAADGLLWYVMPYVEGETLRSRLKRERQLSVDEALRVVREVAEALDYAHGHAVIHRDIKPENILLSEGHALVADFGVARAVTEAGGQLITSTGSALGTPAYMSPEQGAGDPGIDGRSDIYSLGCVLYEMLAGEPPFTGPTPQAVIARHISQPPPSLRVVRTSVPAEVERAIERALSKAPADRFSTAGALVDALSEGAPSALPAGRRWAIRKRWLVATSFAVATGALAFVLPRVFFGGEVSPTAYVMASFAGGPSAGYRVLEHELYRALRQVPDITLVESLRVNDQVLRRGEATDLSSWLAVARALRAGRLLVPTATGAEDSIEIVAWIYDVRRGRAIGRAEVGMGRGVADLAAQAARLAERLFGLPAGVVRTSASTVDAATRAFVSGMSALRTWDLAAAATHLRDAITHDPDYTQAHFWSAQVKAWTGDPSDQWIGSARRAVAGADRLVDRKERTLAAALLALAERQFPQACARYDSLVAVDSLDFQAWFGLGECHSRDDVVIPDPGSLTRWRWRSSFHAAVAAYERALQVAPSFVFAFPPSQRLASILIVDPYRLRPGRPLAPDTGAFWAYASVDHDTLAFVPLPLAAIAATPPPATLGAAIDQNRERLLRIVSGWARAFPDSSRPHFELARALELLAALDGGSSVEHSALAAARRARGTARLAADSLNATVLEVRLLVKLSRFAEARDLASRTLSRWRNPEPEQAAQLASLAALTGRAHRTAQLNGAAAPRLRSRPPHAVVPAPILETAFGGLLGYAAVGAPAESIVVFAARLDTVLQVHASPAQVTRFRCLELRMPVAYAFPQLGRVADPARCREGVPVLEMQWALSRGDTAAIQESYQRGRVLRRDILPGDIAIQHIYHEAWVLVQAGDSAEAGRYLSRSLAALRSMRASVIRDEPEQAAGLVRAMALRAELAAAAGDWRTARRWAEPVTILWRDADPELRPAVDRMRTLARLRRP